MAATLQTAPDRTRCFGQYRQQSVQYALAHCLECPKIKACVRLAWSNEKPARARRGPWDEGRAGGRGQAPSRSGRIELLAT
jgi:hypothetical protein